MSTEYIFFVAMGVFALMVIGIILTMIEFNKLTEEPSKLKGAVVSEPPNRPATRADIRVVSSRTQSAA
ncbi:MAG: hypothetical protein ACR2QG_06390 [Gammaproteobacteria bacterium]